MDIGLIPYGKASVSVTFAQSTWLSIKIASALSVKFPSEWHYLAFQLNSFLYKIAYRHYMISAVLSVT